MAVTTTKMSLPDDSHWESIVTREIKKERDHCGTQMRDTLAIRTQVGQWRGEFYAARDRAQRRHRKRPVLDYHAPYGWRMPS